MHRRFATLETPGRSPLYGRLAHAVADDAELLGFLATLPEFAWQPQLLFSAVQYLQGPLASRAQFADVVRTRRDDVAAVMRSHTTQTNIPARCATLLPALAALPPPLALVEVGASAGLCLYPDRYSYDYDGHRVLPVRPSGVPPFRCTASPGTPLPGAPVEVVWRAGLDLHPLDVHDADDVAWLDALVWPGEEHLRAQLHGALDLARAEPVTVRAGDLGTDLPALLAEAPIDATLVVFHTAVFPYVDEPARAAFAEAVGSSRAVWLANESPARIPGLDRSTVDTPDHQYLLCRDGRPLARADPHASWIEWL
ncbi:MAG: hypothetical protein QOK35_1629 [Pseudonocardiales bacterium]|jgi:hypothetical protein|nr:hypothetical protein [Pseudonocardiales bacterium]